MIKYQYGDNIYLSRTYLSILAINRPILKKEMIEKT